MQRQQQVSAAVMWRPLAAESLDLIRRKGFIISRSRPKRSQFQPKTVTYLGVGILKALMNAGCDGVECLSKPLWEPWDAVMARGPASGGHGVEFVS